MLKEQNEKIGDISNYEEKLLELFLTSENEFDYMVMTLRFFISAYLR